MAKGDLKKPDTQQERRRKDVFTIIEREGYDKPLWVRVGTGWVNRDGSINVRLDALPVNGQLHIRDHEEREPASGKETEG